ncbi:hypothetical protein [Mesorhizobium sp.]|uniref:hypothetical protein n=2 Tax=Mesorhizobium sp. TaxID=1871066 RepID=UPI002579737B|nr:hypothetical protein [Mesorhizobium sp.]
MLAWSRSISAPGSSGACCGDCCLDAPMGTPVIVALARQRLVLAARTRPQIVPAREIVVTLGYRYRAARVEARRYAGLPAWRRRTRRRHATRF